MTTAEQPAVQPARSGDAHDDGDSPAIPQLRAVTVGIAEVDLPGGLRTLLAADANPLSWIRRGQGFVGRGISARFDSTGTDRFADAQQWWRQVAAPAKVDNRVLGPGTGPFAFGTFTFAASSQVPSTVVVPHLVVGVQGERIWITEQRTDDTTPDEQSARTALKEWVKQAQAELETPAHETGGTIHEGALTAPQWADAVRTATEWMANGRLSKLVLARDIVVERGEQLNVSAVLRTLSEAYRECWTYSVDGLIGATPEMLIKVESSVARARVLAGTLDRRAAPADDPDYAQRVLWGSTKQRQEHQFAIDSLLDRLTRFTDAMDVSSTPFVLELPNVWHLASDVSAQLNDATTATGKVRTPDSLALAEALHPTAAVCGTPTDVAFPLIEELETLDRGRYAGPVGWMDSAGNGEWGIALRGASIETPNRARLFAGCGIVEASDPDAEVAETWAKFRPMLQALGVDEPDTGSAQATNPSVETTSTHA